MAEFSLVTTSLKRIDLKLSTGTGEGTLETEDITGYIESIAFDTPSEARLLVETPGMLGTPILDLLTNTRYFTPRISPNDAAGDRFNFGAQKIAIDGPLIITVKGVPGTTSRMSILISDN